MKANPEWRIGEIGKEVGSQWNSLSDAKKEPFLNKASKLKEAYDKKMEKYKKTKDYARHQEALTAWKNDQARKPFKKDPNKPKKAMTAYMHFLTEKRPGLVEEGLEVTEIMKHAGDMWSKLTSAQKKPYEKKAAISKKEAAAAMEKYKKTKT